MIIAKRAGKPFDAALIDMGDAFTAAFRGTPLFQTPPPPLRDVAGYDNFESARMLLVHQFVLRRCGVTKGIDDKEIKDSLVEDYRARINAIFLAQSDESQHPETCRAAKALYAELNDLLTADDEARAAQLANGNDREARRFRHIAIAEKVVEGAFPKIEANVNAYIDGLKAARAPGD